MKQFLKKTELQLVNGGYLSNNEGSPVTNKAFVEAQKHAEYIVTYAALSKGKDFVGKKADTLASLQKEVENALSKKDVQYIDAPSEIERTITDGLAKEAMAFMNFGAAKDKTDKMNKFLQQFNVLHEFEEFGLFFKDGIVKLDKIYTMEEVVSAVKSVIDLLD